MFIILVTNDACRHLIHESSHIDKSVQEFSDSIRHIRQIWRTHTSNLTHTYVSFETKEMQVCDIVWGCTTRMNESCDKYECGSYTYEWVISRMRMSHDTCEWVMSRIWMSHVSTGATRLNAWWHTYEWFMSHMWMRHVTHINESCYICRSRHRHRHRHRHIHK